MHKSRSCRVDVRKTKKIFSWFVLTKPNLNSAYVVSLCLNIVMQTPDSSIIARIEFAECAESLLQCKDDGRKICGKYV